MKTIIKPIKVIDEEIYKAVYLIGEKVYLVKIDPTIEDVDTVTIYSSVKDYEKKTGDTLDL